MTKVRIEIKGVAAEIVLGNYMPTDTTIINNWEDFYNYNDVIHQTLLLKEHLTEFRIFINDQESKQQVQRQLKYVNAKTVIPYMEQEALYLRTECVENASFICEFETTSDFDLNKLNAVVQDYDALFKVSSHFIEALTYEGKQLELQWQSGKPIGNICLLCTYKNGYLVPIYDAIKKIKA